MLSQHVVINVLYKALHEAVLHSFCRTAAWLMQVRVDKIGYPRTGLWFKVTVTW